MFNFQQELYLREYFTFSAVLSNTVDEKLLFSLIGDIYCVPVAEQKRLYKLVTLAAVTDIHTDSDYKRYLRIHQYADLQGIDYEQNKTETMLITVKGRILSALKEKKICMDRYSTKTDIFNNITAKANEGLVTALRILGVLQCEGLLFERNKAKGLKNLSRASRWNSPESEMALLKYDEAGRESHLNRLNTMSENSPFEEMVAAAKERYGLSMTERAPECELLSKAFGRKTLDCAVYKPSYANLLYSEIVGFKDKEKLLLRDSYQSEAVINELPLKLKTRPFVTENAILKGAAVRERDLKELERRLNNHELRNRSEYCPMCLDIDSAVETEQYYALLQEIFKDANIVKIHVNRLSGYDFSCDINNVFLRSCNAEKNNVFVLILRGDIEENAVR